MCVCVCGGGLAPYLCLLLLVRGRCIPPWRQVSGMLITRTLFSVKLNPHDLSQCPPTAALGRHRVPHGRCVARHGASMLMIHLCFKRHFPYPLFLQKKEGMEYEPIALFFLAPLLAFRCLVGSFVCLCVDVLACLRHPLFKAWRCPPGSSILVFLEL